MDMDVINTFPKGIQGFLVKNFLCTRNKIELIPITFKVRVTHAIEYIEFFLTVLSIKQITYKIMLLNIHIAI